MQERHWNLITTVFLVELFGVQVYALKQMFETRPELNGLIMGCTGVTTFLLFWAILFAARHTVDQFREYQYQQYRQQHPPIDNSDLNELLRQATRSAE
jgi:hypothetical protein